MKAQVAPKNWFPRRGEVYLVRLDKDRPALVLSADALNRHALDVCVVPMTTVERAEFSLRVRIARGEAGLKKDSWAKCDRFTPRSANSANPHSARLSMALS
jgi:mRNA-degrading endonuclease toxin of MazEF toxin-antitoxin module